MQYVYLPLLSVTLFKLKSRAYDQYHETHCRRRSWVNSYFHGTFVTMLLLHILRGSRIRVYFCTNKFVSVDSCPRLSSLLRRVVYFIGFSTSFTYCLLVTATLYDSTNPFLPQAFLLRLYVLTVHAIAWIA